MISKIILANPIKNNGNSYYHNLENTFKSYSTEFGSIDPLYLRSYSINRRYKSSSSDRIFYSKNNRQNLISKALRSNKYNFYSGKFINNYPINTNYLINSQKLGSIFGQNNTYWFQTTAGLNQSFPKDLFLTILSINLSNINPLDSQISHTITQNGFLIDTSLYNIILNITRENSQICNINSNNKTIIEIPSHNFNINDEIVFNSVNNLPNIIYYIINDNFTNDTISISNSIGGNPITIDGINQLSISPASASVTGVNLNLNFNNQLDINLNNPILVNIKVQEINKPPAIINTVINTKNSTTLISKTISELSYGESGVDPIILDSNTGWSGTPWYGQMPITPELMNLYYDAPFDPQIPELQFHVISLLPPPDNFGNESGPYLYDIAFREFGSSDNFTIMTESDLDSTFNVYSYKNTISLVDFIKHNGVSQFKNVDNIILNLNTLNLLKPIPTTYELKVRCRKFKDQNNNWIDNPIIGNWVDCPNFTTIIDPPNIVLQDFPIFTSDGNYQILNEKIYFTYKHNSPNSFYIKPLSLAPKLHSSKQFVLQDKNNYEYNGTIGQNEYYRYLDLSSGQGWYGNSLSYQVIGSKTIKDVLADFGGGKIVADKIWAGYDYKDIFLNCNTYSNALRKDWIELDIDEYVVDYRTNPSGVFIKTDPEPINLNIKNSHDQYWQSINEPINNKILSNDNEDDIGRMNISTHGDPCCETVEEAYSDYMFKTGGFTSQDIFSKRKKRQLPYFGSGSGCGPISTPSSKYRYRTIYPKPFSKISINSFGRNWNRLDCLKYKSCSAKIQLEDNTELFLNSPYSIISNPIIFNINSNYLPSNIFQQIQYNFVDISDTTYPIDSWGWVNGNIEVDPIIYDNPYKYIFISERSNIIIKYCTNSVINPQDCQWSTPYYSKHLFSYKLYELDGSSGSVNDVTSDLISITSNGLTSPLDFSFSAQDGLVFSMVTYQYNVNLNPAAGDPNNYLPDTYKAHNFLRPNIILINHSGKRMDELECYFQNIPKPPFFDRGFGHASSIEEYAYEPTTIHHKQKIEIVPANPPPTIGSFPLGALISIKPKEWLFDTNYKIHDKEPNLPMKNTSNESVRPLPPELL